MNTYNVQERARRFYLNADEYKYIKTYLTRVLRKECRLSRKSEIDNIIVVSYKMNLPRMLDYVCCTGVEIARFTEYKDGIKITKIIRKKPKTHGQYIRLVKQYIDTIPLEWNKQEHVR